MFLTYLAGDVARRQALDLADGRSTGVDRGERGTIDRGSTHVLLNRYYNGWIRCDVAASDGAIAWSADHGRLIKTRA